MWFKVAVAVIVAVEWALIVVVGGFVVWAIVSWVVPGQCTGFACW
jgi:hypothetical protein